MEMQTDPRPMIVRNVLAFFAFHGVLFAILFSVYDLPPSSLWYYLGLSLLVHGGITGFLVFMKDSFYYLADKSPMKYMGIPNLLTLFRITSAPSIMVLLMYIRGHEGAMPWLLGYTILAFVSDFLDGLVSRATGKGTRIGQFLDSSSDYVVLILVGFIFSWFNLIDSWFFWLVIGRFSSQWILVGILFFKGHRGEEVSATLLGKASVFTTMSLFGLAILQILPFFTNHYVVVRNVIFYGEILVALVLVLSLAEKVMVFIKGLAKTAD